jgi:hypothetical protein
LRFANIQTVPFAYKRASRAFRSATICPLCEQRPQAIEALFGNRAKSLGQALDRFWLRAQDHSYTNDRSVVTD